MGCGFESAPSVLYKQAAYTQGSAVRHHFLGTTPHTQIIQVGIVPSRRATSPSTAYTSRNNTLLEHIEQLIQQLSCRYGANPAQDMTLLDAARSVHCCTPSDHRTDLEKLQTSAAVFQSTYNRNSEFAVIAAADPPPQRPPMHLWGPSTLGRHATAMHRDHAQRRAPTHAAATHNTRKTSPENSPAIPKNRPHFNHINLYPAIRHRRTALVRRAGACSENCARQIEVTPFPAPRAWHQPGTAPVPPDRLDPPPSSQHVLCRS